jgi:hypothetical protein
VDYCQFSQRVPEALQPATLFYWHYAKPTQYETRTGIPASAMQDAPAHYTRKAIIRQAATGWRWTWKFDFGLEIATMTVHP